MPRPARVSGLGFDNIYQYLLQQNIRFQEKNQDNVVFSLRESNYHEEFSEKHYKQKADKGNAIMHWEDEDTSGNVVGDIGLEKTKIRRGDHSLRTNRVF